MVQEFVAGWLKTRRSRRGQRGYQEGDVDALSPYEWLAFDTGLPESEIRKIRSPKRYPLAELRVADAITNSIGEPLMMYDGTLEVMPNPLVPARASAECCGGSETARYPGGDVTIGLIVRASVTLTVTAGVIPESVFARLHLFAERDRVADAV